MKKNIRDFFDFYGDDTIELKEIPKISTENIYKLTNTRLRKENEVMKKTNKRIFTGLVASVICLLMTATVFATIYFLSPSDVAKEIGNTKLAEIFEKNENTNLDIAPQESNGYSIDILGIASGKDLSLYTEAENDQTYIVGSIAKANGEAITDYTDIMITPLVSGYAPWEVNIFTLNNGAKHSFIKNGIEYFIIENSNLSIFADHTIYIATYEGVAPSSEIFNIDKNGNISFNENYKGVKTLFTVPFDKSLADQKAVSDLLNSSDEKPDLSDNTINSEIILEPAE